MTTLDDLLRDGPAPRLGWPSEVFSGGARGPDQAGVRWAERRGVACSIFRAEWSRLGKRAGVVRNEQMALVASGRAVRNRTTAHLVAFHDGTSRGTADMIDRARRYALGVTVIR